jgi:hypothetical protein
MVEEIHAERDDVAAQRSLDVHAAMPSGPSVSVGHAGNEPAAPAPAPDSDPPAPRQ